MPVDLDAIRKRLNTLGSPTETVVYIAGLRRLADEVPALIAEIESLREESAEAYARALDPRGAVSGWRPFGTHWIFSPFACPVGVVWASPPRWVAVHGDGKTELGSGTAGAIRGAMRAAETCLREHGWKPENEKE